jgi:hypothetical protein
LVAAVRALGNAIGRLFADWPPLGPDGFAIRYRPGGATTVRGRVPSGKVGGIRAFFEHDLAADAPVTVRGSLGPGRAVRSSIQGDLTPAQRQRVRNFLAAHLG